VGQAARRRTDSDVQNIQGLLAEVRRTSRLNDMAAHAAADKSFHMAAVRACGNEFLADIYEQVTAAFGEYLSTCDIDKKTQAAHDHWHEVLLKAIATGDVRSARQAATTVIELNRRFLEQAKCGHQSAGC
jgi:DNA-binding FadR family transcriptional regulator